MDFMNAHLLAHSYPARAAIAVTLTATLGLLLSGCDTGVSSNSGTGSVSSDSLVTDSFVPDPNSSASAARDSKAPEHLRVEILNTYPFDTTSFTQGLEVDADGISLLVATGKRGESRIYRTTLDGQESDSHDIDPQFFGEGVTRTLDNTTVWQLTWQEGVAIKRDASTLEEIGTTTYEGEGWGLCAFQDTLYFSDGTSTLRILDPATFAQRGTVSVTSQGHPVEDLNELECVPASESPTGQDTVYANRFLTTDIVRIDAATGTVTGVIDASTLPNNATPDPNHVLNGIAHIPGSTDRFYLTGKRWPDLYEVRISPAG